MNEHAAVNYQKYHDGSWELPDNWKELVPEPHKHCIEKYECWHAINIKTQFDSSITETFFNWCSKFRRAVVTQDWRDFE